MQKRPFSRLGIGWQLGVASGWGTYGLNLALELVRHGVEPAIFFTTPGMERGLPAELAPALAQSPKWFEDFSQGPFTADFPMLMGFGDKLDMPDGLRPLKGQPTVGVVFCESSVIPVNNLMAVTDFPVFIAGSSWNAEILTKHGLTVRTCLQGVDLSVFHPRPRGNRFGDRFVIFSGGKLEYRKGQDLVLAAFKRFHARHPDALLVTAWQNPWPEIAADMANSPHVSGPLMVKNGSIDVQGWLGANGLGPNAGLDVGVLSHEALASLLGDVDVAVAASRCEGGTNLVAMECMAAGIPTILSRNTGHLDLVAPERCYSLDFQIPIAEVTGRVDLQGWGESSIDEIVAKLEEVYAGRDEAKRRGQAAAAFMQDWGWPAQIERLLTAIAEFV